MADLRIALDQCAPPAGDLDAALRRLDAVAGRAAEAGVALLVTPEMALTGYNIGAEAVRRVAQPLDGPRVAAVAEIARRHGLAIAAGLPELCADAVVRNTVVLVDAAGALLGAGSKTHLYGDVDRSQFAPAPELPALVELHGWRLALAICYDIEFPELARCHALAGADAILVPTANMLPFDSVATRLVPARAEENALFVAYANYCGEEGGFRYCGLSCVCGPDGEDLARAGRDELLLIAELERARLPAARQRATYLRDRRPDLYAALLNGQCQTQRGAR